MEPAAFLLEPQHNVMQMGGDFANNPAAAQFIDKMVAKHGFDRQQLQEILSQAKRLDSRPAADGSSGADRACRQPADRRLAALQETVHYPRIMCRTAWVFWNQYQDALNRAYQVYGVPPEIIVGHYWRGDSLGPGDWAKPGSSTRWRRCRLATRAAPNTSRRSWKLSC
ncbi:murein hydrolase B [Klebsiella pneumoniae subsp. ozaenae]|uniref:Murein hydrolase B n=1 Tax=Klebsiella pneumoniae subsp. ozaenae TaxID=574 RepID=A0A378AEL8_KLEPO|nr:murein hydrolase B [Klebsiella pneumoniae subsp. ozaenae]